MLKRVRRAVAVAFVRASMVAIPVLCTTIIVVCTATPASAHTVSGSGATNYRTSMRSLIPPVPGLQLSVQEAGNRMELVNNTGGNVVVLGYQNEPYLRVTPHGVYENLRSPSLYANRTVYATSVAPATADAQAPPQWHHVSGANLVTWHDHRVHWMSAQAPPAVRAAPDSAHLLISDWQITLQLASGAVVATGDLTWVPAPALWPWLLLIAISLLLTVALTVQGKRRPGVAALLIALTLIDVVHTLGLGLATAGTWADKAGKLGGSFYSVLIWGAGLWAARAVLRSRVKPSDDASLLVIFVGLCTAVVSGLGDISLLTHSQLVFAWPWWVARMATALTIGMGFGLALGAGLWLWDWNRNPLVARLRQPVRP